MLISLCCPQCNGTLSVENNRELFFCPYCGAKVMHEQTQNITNNYYGNDTNPDVLFERWVNAVCDGVGDASRAKDVFLKECYFDKRINIVKNYDFEYLCNVHYNGDDGLSMNSQGWEDCRNRELYRYNEVYNELINILPDNIVRTKLINKLLAARDENINRLSCTIDSARKREQSARQREQVRYQLEMSNRRKERRKEIVYISIAAIVITATLLGLVILSLFSLYE